MARFGFSFGGALGKVSGFVRWFVPERLQRLFLEPPRMIYILPRSTSSTSRYVVWEQANQLFGTGRPSKKAEFESLDELGRHLSARKKHGMGTINVQLVLPEESCFSLKRDIPAKTVRNAENILRLEMERVAPFSADQVYISHCKTGGKTENKELIEVILFAAKRSVLDPLVKLVADSGLPVFSISVIGSGERQYPVNMLHGMETSDLPKRFGYYSNRLIVGLFALALLGVTAYVVADSWIRFSTLQSLQGELASVRKIAMDKNRNLNKIRYQLEEIRSLREEKNFRPSLVAIWNELSGQINLDSWLDGFQLKGDKVLISGSSKSASGLIRSLDQSTIFTDVAFSSPVLLDPLTKLERFEINLTVVPASYGGDN